MHWTPLKRRVWIFLILGSLLLLNVLVRDYIPGNLRGVIDSLVVLAVSLVVLFVLIQEFRNKKQRATKGDLDREMKKIAEGMQRGREEKEE